MQPSRLPEVAQRLGISYVGATILAMVAIVVVLFLNIELDLRKVALRNISYVVETEEFFKKAALDVKASELSLNQTLYPAGYVNIHLSTGAVSGVSSGWKESFFLRTSSKQFKIPEHDSQVIVDVLWSPGLPNVGTHTLAVAIIGIVSILFVVSWFFLGRINEGVFTPLFSWLSRTEDQVVIAGSLQMFAHDVRKPFYMISNLLRLLKSNEFDETEIRNMLPKMSGRIDSAVNHAENMIRDLLALGKEDSSDWSDQSVFECIDHALNNAAGSALGQNVEITYKLNHSRMLYADRNMTVRILTNLLSNGLEATGEGGRIWVASKDILQKGGHFVQFRIGNTGSAIPAEVLSSLFKPFKTHGKKGGTGLGLTIVKKFVEAHNGNTAVESEDLSGTEFIFTLPASTTPDVSSLRLPSTLYQITQTFVAEPSLQKRKLGQNAEGTNFDELRFVDEKILVIVVDDDPFVTDLWQDSSKGIAAITFDRPESCLEFLSDFDTKEQIFCIVSDYYFDNSETDGHVFARDIHTQFGFPVIISSGVSDELNRIHEVVAYIPKQVLSVEELKTLIGVNLRSSTRNVS